MWHYHHYKKRKKVFKKRRKCVILSLTEHLTLQYIVSELLPGLNNKIKKSVTFNCELTFGLQRHDDFICFTRQIVGNVVLIFFIEHEDLTSYSCMMTNVCQFQSFAKKSNSCCCEHYVTHKQWLNKLIEPQWRSWRNLESQESRKGRANKSDWARDWTRLSLRQCCKSDLPPCLYGDPLRKTLQKFVFFPLNKSNLKN